MIEVGIGYDFNGFPIKDFAMNPSASTPSVPVDAMPWWESDTQLLKIYDGTNAAWRAIILNKNTITSGRVPVWDGTGGYLGNGTDFVVATTVGATGDDVTLVTEQGIREAIAAAIASEVSWKGGYNAATNTPDLDTSPSGVKAGDMYYVTVAGTFFTTPLEAGDVIIANIDDADAENEWTMVQKNLPSVIPVANGGTGITSYAVGDLLYADTTSTLAKLSDVAAGSYLRSGGVNTAPVWSTLTLPNTSAINQLLYSSAANTVSNLAISTTTGTFLRNTSAAGLPGWSTLVLPNALAINQMMYASAANVVSALAISTTTGTFLRNTSAAGLPGWSTLVLPNAASAGQLMRASGSNTIAMSTVTMPDTLAAYSIFVANSANTLVALTPGAGNSIRVNAGGTAWEAYTPSTVTQYTDEMAQDAINAMLVDTNTIDFTYTDATPELKFDVKVQMSITSDASGIKLSGDSASPGNTMLYGTNGAGVKGWYAQPTSGTGNAYAFMTDDHSNTISASGSDTVYLKENAWGGITVYASEETNDHITFTLNFNNIANATTTLGTNDVFAIYDATTDSRTEKITYANLLSEIAADISLPINNLSDVTITSITSGHILVWTGSAFENKKIKHTETIGNGSLTQFTITHNLNTRDIVLVVLDASTYQEIKVQWAATTTTAATVDFGAAPASSSRIVIVYGLNY